MESDDRAMLIKRNATTGGDYDFEEVGVIHQSTAACPIDEARLVASSSVKAQR